jgi:eukaryotic-like serine/threonine-protein kinase
MNPGDKLERYEIRSLLGRGGMGEVYRAYDPKLQREVALKVLLPEHGGQGSQAAGSMLREARAAAALNHPNAISVFDIGEWHGGMYIAMELIAGKSLRSYVGAADVPAERKLRWMADVARALGAAHKAGIIHRDIKPENVMIRDDGVVKVLDFGIARRTAVPSDATAEMAALSTATGSGVIVGTPMYMAPEQIRGEDLDSRTDQFAWGVTAWELLTGELPWGPSRAAIKVLAAILTADAAPLSTRGVPDPVSEVVARTLSKARDARFSSMEEIADQLDPRDAGARVSVEKAPVGQPAAAQTSPQPMSDTGEQPAKRGMRPLALAAAALIATAGVAAFWMGTRNGPATAAQASASASSQAATPISSNPEATLAWQRGERAFRGASTTIAHRELDQALKLDPAMAPALLRLALMDYTATPSHARELLQRASQNKERLGAADRALLDAAETWMVRNDRDGWIEGLSRAVGQFPRDGLLQTYLAVARAQKGDLQGALQAVDAAIAAEPGLGLAWLRRGRLQLLMGDLSASAEAYEQCLKLSSTAVDCLEERISLRSREGHCEEALADAQSVVNADPRSASGYFTKANLLAGLERPREAVFVALGQQWERIQDAAERKQGELNDRIAYEELQGHFQEALKLVGEWQTSIAQSPDLIDQAGPSASICELNLEIGKPGIAAQAATEFLARVEAYSPIQRNQDLSFVFLESLQRGGKLTNKQFEERRASWFRNEQLRWLHGYAMFARTREQAEAALAIVQDAGGVPSWHARSIASDLAVGKVYALAGRSAEALPYLKAAARACDVLADPMAQTQAHLYLGIALADSGDKQGACKAWQVVLGRWGTSGSITAQETRKRAKDAGC